MEQWLRDRQAYARVLQQRVRKTASPEAVTAYERFLRQTAHMEVVAGELSRELQSPFSVAHGLRLQNRGREIYLEHLVVGPTGIFLIETLEGDDPYWQADLAEKIAFFRQVLGADSGFFLCLAIAGTPSCPNLPDGALLVDSLEMAIQVVKDQRTESQMPPSVAQELWRVLGSLRVKGPLRPESDAYLERVSRREWALFLATLAMNGVITILDGNGWLSWWAGFVLLVLPVGAVMALILLMRRERHRRTDHPHPGRGDSALVPAPGGWPHRPGRVGDALRTSGPLHAKG